MHRPFRHRTILPRFTDAFRGLVHAYRTEPNLRFHVFAGAVVYVVGVASHLEGWEIAYLLITVILVLAAEIMNTAVERTVDLAAGGKRHPLAARAKEVAAGGVALTALHALCAAGFVFVARRGLFLTWNAVIDLFRRSPWWMAIPIIAALMGLYSPRETGEK